MLDEPRCRSRPTGRDRNAKTDIERVLFGVRNDRRRRSGPDHLNLNRLHLSSSLTASVMLLDAGKLGVDFGPNFRLEFSRSVLTHARERIARM